MAYGERIRFYRVLRNMSQEDLAEQTGITYTSISRIEHGTRKVTLDEAVRFAEVLRISLLELAGVPELLSQTEEVKTMVNQCATKMHEALTAVSASCTIADDLQRTLVVTPLP